MYNYEIRAHFLYLARRGYPVERICRIYQELRIVYLEKAVAVILLLLMKEYLGILHLIRNSLYIKALFEAVYHSCAIIGYSALIRVNRTYHHDLFSFLFLAHLLSALSAPAAFSSARFSSSLLPHSIFLTLY